MKKLVFAALLCLLVVPTLAFAQADWDLSQEVWVDTLGVRFNVPDGWVSATAAAGTYVAETQEDLDALNDNDPETKAAGFAVAITSLPEDTQGIEGLGVEEIAQLLATSSQADVTDSGAVVVNLRPAYYVFGTSTSNGTTSYLAIWKQDDNVVVFGFLIPEANASDELGFTFGQLLGTVRPIVSEDFVAADENYEVTDLGYTIAYPAEWTAANGSDTAGVPGVIFAEIAEDIGAEVAEGTLVTILQIPGSIEDLELTEESEVEDYVTAYAGLLGIENVVSQGEFVINDEWGVGFTGNSATSGRPGLGIVTYNEDAEAFNVYIVASPDDETLAYYIPIFEIMLWSIRPIEE